MFRLIWQKHDSDTSYPCKTVRHSVYGSLHTSRKQSEVIKRRLTPCSGQTPRRRGRTVTHVTTTACCRDAHLILASGDHELLKRSGVEALGA
ncbi:hypothetical protein EYF80_064082 [Liparis tanakae]|uniref:Uncharacterized protein n=1 Tax=Liparis tanakae TaxID=230148 RepID=A0A4Z2EA83_9TELE|nr:hypothetical protein EYF80_064082 [Liparis tanakae]